MLHFLFSRHHHIYNVVCDVYSLKELNKTLTVTCQVRESEHFTILWHNEM